MNQNSINFFNNSASPDDSLFHAIGKAAEEEMLLEYEILERQSGEIKIPEHVESRILKMAAQHSCAMEQNTKELRLNDNTAAR
jgi:hypothetical protein